MHGALSEEVIKTKCSRFVLNSTRPTKITIEKRERWRKREREEESERKRKVWKQTRKMTCTFTN